MLQKRCGESFFTILLFKRRDKKMGNGQTDGLIDQHINRQTDQRTKGLIGQQANTLIQMRGHIQK